MKRSSAPSKRVTTKEGKSSSKKGKVGESFSDRDALPEISEILSSSAGELQMLEENSPDAIVSSVGQTEFSEDTEPT